MDYNQFLPFMLILIVPDLAIGSFPFHTASNVPYVPVILWALYYISLFAHAHSLTQNVLYSSTGISFCFKETWFFLVDNGIYKSKSQH